MNTKGKTPKTRAARVPSELQQLAAAELLRRKLTTSAAPSIFAKSGRPRFKVKADEPNGVIPACDPSENDAFVDALDTSMGSVDTELGAKMLNDLVAVVPGLPVGRANVAMATMEAIAPRDGVEALLAAQMAMVHHLAARLARHGVTEKTVEGLDSAVNRITKLLRTFTAQVEALQRYRTQGKQQIVVQHQRVNVEPGGQAAIGTFHAVSKSTPSRAPQTAVAALDAPGGGVGHQLLESTP